MHLLRKIDLPLSFLELFGRAGMAGGFIGVKQDRTVMRIELGVTFSCTPCLGIPNDVLLFLQTSHDGVDHAHDWTLQLLDGKDESVLILGIGLFGNGEGDGFVMGLGGRIGYFLHY